MTIQRKNTNNKKKHYNSKNVEGVPNEKYVDLLDEDKAISGQKFVCVSFLSPENILKKKEIFFFEEFLNNWEFDKEMQKFVQFLNFVSYKYNLTFEDLMNDFTDFVKDEKESLVKSGIEEDYKTYLDNNEEKLEIKFNKANKFQTNTRGIKVRGCFPTVEEAEFRCKILRGLDPNHDVFVGPVGMWMPWDPKAYKTGRVEYMEDELNHLMHEKQKNEETAKNEFEQHIKETKKKAIEENRENAEKYGNVITQTLDENGNLISVNNTNTQENELLQKDNLSISDIKNKLFEGDNVVINKSDNGKSELVGGPLLSSNDRDNIAVVNSNN